MTMLLTPAQIKPKSFESRRNSFFFFYPGVDASRVYVRAWALGCFHSLNISTRNFRRALTASVDSRGGTVSGVSHSEHRFPAKVGCRKPVLGVWWSVYCTLCIYLLSMPLGCDRHSVTLSNPVGDSRLSCLLRICL